MKKYLLTALLGVFGLFGFVSADTITFDYNSSDDSYTPSSYNNSSDVQLSLSNYNCSGEATECGIAFIDNNDNDNIFDIYYFQGLIYFKGEEVSGDLVFTLSAGSYDVVNDSQFGFNSISFNVLSSDSDSSPLLSGGTTAFSGIITSLGSTISEFIPYVAYIGLGLLGAIIGFVAIKWLINWIRAKVLGSFNSRRRK